MFTIGSRIYGICFVRFGLNFYILRHRVSLHAQPIVGLTAERGSGSDKILKYLIHSDTEREGERREKVKRQGKHGRSW